MTCREQFQAVLHYQRYDAMPIVHFGYREETLKKWVSEGHLKTTDISGFEDGSEVEQSVSGKLGFDCAFLNIVNDKTSGTGFYLYPPFPEELIEVRPDGAKLIRNALGVVTLHKDGINSIHPVSDSLLKDRESWEKLYKPRLTYTAERVDSVKLETLAKNDSMRRVPLGLSCGSLAGAVREIIGLEDLCYMLHDDSTLVEEIFETIGELSYKIVQKSLSFGVKFDFAHFWEDICYKNGPIFNPKEIHRLTAHNYRRITTLLRENGVDIISLDSDGVIDEMLPVWFDAGINTIVPIEVGVWGASIAPWRKQYGKTFCGVGGVNKEVLGMDYRAIDKEIERLRPLVELEGYIPCLDHLIPPNAVWENCQYYTDAMRKAFTND